MPIYYYDTFMIVHLTSVGFYPILIKSPIRSSFMSVTYGSKSKYRVTLELDMLEDFSPHNINWEKLLDAQGSEKVSSYVEDLSTPDRW